MASHLQRFPVRCSSSSPFHPSPFSFFFAHVFLLSSLPQLSRLLNKWRPNPSWPPIVTVLTSDIRLNSLSTRCKSREREEKIARFPKYPPLLSNCFVATYATRINISWKSLVRSISFLTSRKIIGW